MGQENKVTLGGASMIWNGIKQDYHIIETLDCLYELCDEVSVSAGGDDGTWDLVYKWALDHSDRKIHLYRIGEHDWIGQVGREKLSYFSNIAIEALTTDWFIYVQADECLHEQDFTTIRNAVNEANYVVSLGDNQIDALMVRRLNLWKTPLQMLNVEQARKPVSTEVIRLCRKHCRCIDDAESCAANNVVIYGDIDDIQIWHTGFVRDPVKHLEKIRHMQTEVFLWGDFDVKAKDCTEFQPDRWFDPEKDLIPVPHPLPKYIKQWTRERYPELTID